VEARRGAPIHADRRPASRPATADPTSRPIGGDALVCCTVAPGLDFDDFRLRSGDSDAAGRLRALDADMAALL